MTQREGHVGPLVLGAAWVLHDVEEALTFPAACDDLADALVLDAVRMTRTQSWLAVALMGGVVGVACALGARTRGRSAMYRAALAGLEAHVGTHVAASVLTRRYTPGLLTALPVMLPGCRLAVEELERDGIRLTAADRVRGAALLLPAAVLSHVVARRLGRPAR